MKKIFLLLLICLLSLPFIYAQSIIVLKNGNEIEGRLIEETDEYIKIDLDGITLTYWMDEIKSIYPENFTGSNEPKNTVEHLNILQGIVKVDNYQKGTIKIIALNTPLGTEQNIIDEIIVPAPGPFRLSIPKTSNEFFLFSYNDANNDGPPYTKGDPVYWGKQNIVNGDSLEPIAPITLSVPTLDSSENMPDLDFSAFDNDDILKLTDYSNKDFRKASALEQREIIQFFTDLKKISEDNAILKALDLVTNEVILYKFDENNSAFIAAQTAPDYKKYLLNLAKSNKIFSWNFNINRILVSNSGLSAIVYYEKNVSLTNKEFLNLEIKNAPTKCLLRKINEQWAIDICFDYTTRRNIFLQPL